MPSSVRTFAVALVPAVVTALAWLRLESPADRLGAAAAVTALALVPPLVRPPAARAGATVVSVVLAAWIAFDLSPLHPRHLPGAFGSRFSNGFLDFYDVRVPFDARVHTDMRGVVLAAVFGFVLAIGLAVAARRPLLASLLLLLGAGWPATLAGSHGALAIGGGILLALLALLAGLTSRTVPRVALPAVAALALAAVAVSSSSAVAKGALVGWQHWDFYNAPQNPVAVSYVWDAQYSGIHFPRKRTTVLRIDAPPRSLFWRAAVLDDFFDDHWLETPQPLRGDDLAPGAPTDRKKLLHQVVHVEALADTHLVGASVPLAFDAGDAPIVSEAKGFAQLPSGLTRGFSYSVWSYAPRPTAVQLAEAPDHYPIELTEEGTFLDVGRNITAPAFAVHDRAAELAIMFRHFPQLERYRPLEQTALRVAGNAPTPYAAAAALEAFFRTKGGFRYTNHPPATTGAPLVAFVTQTRAGYCQHFAGAMALMLRYLGVPARVAVGFSSGTYDEKKHEWTVTDHDAHAWVEAFFPGYGWLPFDPTPPAGRPERSELSAPYAAALRDYLGRFKRTQPAAGQENAQQGAHRHGEQPGTGARVETPHAASQHHGLGGSLLFLLAVVAAALVLAVVATKLVVRRVRYATRDPRRIAAACRQELADYLLDQNIDAARSATLHELGALVQRELGVDPGRFVAAATAARFGPPDAAPQAARRARRELRALRRAIRLHLRTGDRIRGVVSLRSLGFSG